MELLRVVPSTREDKKQDAHFRLATGREKKVSFGARGMEDQTTHKDEARKERQLTRHRANENWEDPLTAGALSRWILWNKPSLRESIADFKRRFNL